MENAELQPIEEPLPDPPKDTGRFGGAISQAGQWLEKGKVKAGETWEKLQENERVAQLTLKTVEVAGQVQEYSQQKIAEVKENERMKSLVQKTGVVIETTLEKTKALMEATTDTKEATKAKTKLLWTRGRGKIVKVRNEMGLAWGASAQEVLLKREEAATKWQDIKIRGAEDITIGARKEYTTSYFVEKGTLMRWSFRVKEHDVGFGVRARMMQDGGSVEEDVLPVERFDNTDTIEGSWVADEDRTMVMVFDNSYSKLRGKTVAYLVGTEPGLKESVVARPSSPGAEEEDEELELQLQPSAT